MTIVKNKYRHTSEYAAVRERLIEAARSESGIVQYRPEIARLIGIDEDDFGDHIPRELGQVCGEISEDEHNEGRPMLSAVAVGEDGTPGKGFYKLARQLGIGFTDEDAFWIEEHRRVAEYWSTH